MNINADFTCRATSHAAGASWVASPSGGVERRMLDRIGGEVARATTIVRFVPGSSFPAHAHGGGEEYFVLEGDFTEGQELFVAHSWLRLPPSAPFVARAGKNGARLLIKSGHLVETEARVEGSIVPATNVLA